MFTPGFVLLVAASGAAVLSESSGSLERRLRLETAIERALENHPSFQVMQSDIEAAEGARISAEARPNPELTLGPGLKRISSEGSRFHGEAEISQVLEFPGKRSLRVFLAEGDIKLRKIAVEGFRQQLRIEVARAYYQALAAQQIALLRSEQVQSAQTFLQSARKRVAGGYASDFESAKAQADWIAARKELGDALASAREAKLMLASLMGNPTDTGFQVDGKIDSAIFAQIPSDPVAVALERNAGIRAQTLQVELAKKGIEAAQVARRPDLTVAPGMEYASDEQTYGINLSMSLPVWNRGKGEIRSAQAEERRARAELEKLKREITASVLAAQEKLRIASEQLALYTPEFLESLKNIMERAEKVYGQSSTTLLIYLEARRSYFESLTDYYQALGEWVASHTELEAALGAPIENDSKRNGVK